MKQVALVICALIFQLSALQAIGSSAGAARAGASHASTPHSSHSAERTPSLSRSYQLPTQKRAAAVSQHAQARKITSQTTAPSHTVKNLNSKHTGENKALTHSQDLVKLNHSQLSSWYSNKFFSTHNRKPFFRSQHGSWFSCSNWNTITSWLPWGWSYPIYYDDEGEGEEVPETDNNTQEAATSYDEEWLPLGVFAVAKTIEQAAYTPMFVQLAVDQNGNIGGTYYNTAQEMLYTLQGSVDKDTQQVTWINSDSQNSPTMSCGIYNLTQEATPIQVQFPSGVKQTWMMVRLNNQ